MSTAKGLRKHHKHMASAHPSCTFGVPLGADERVQGEARDCLEAYWTQRVCKVDRHILEMDVRHCRQEKAHTQGACKLPIMLSSKACNNTNAYNSASPLTLDEALQAEENIQARNMQDPHHAERNGLQQQQHLQRQEPADTGGSPAESDAPTAR